MATLAVRNNNPGNIRDTKSGNFKQFATPQEGYAALLNDLQAKQKGATTTGLGPNSTLIDFATKYAPASDKNNPGQYAANLANHMGVRPDAKLSELNVPKWAAAVASTEDKSSPFAKQEILSGGGNTVNASANNTPQATPTQPQGGDALGTAATIADTLFGSGKVGEALGTQYVKGDLKNRTDIITPDYANLPESVKKRLTAKGVPITQDAQRQEVADTIKGPSALELAGSVGQSALLFAPEGKIVEGLGGGLVGKTLAGAGTGYAYDVASNFGSGKTGSEAFKPGYGTALGAATPLAFLGGKALFNSAVKPTAAVAGSLGTGLKDVLTAPFRALGEKASEAVKVSKLPQAEKMLAKAGIDEGTRGFLQSASAETKKGFKEMVDIMEKKTNFDPNNPLTTGLRSKIQPKKIVGDALLERAEVLTKDSAKARKVINATAMSPGKVDLGAALTQFVDNLEKKGIGIGENGRLTSTGRTPRADLPYYENIFKEIQDVTKGKTEVSKLQAHQLRQRLRDTLDAATRNSPGGALGQRPFSNLVDNDINGLRGLIADQMGTKYKAAAKKFAENESVLRDVAKFAGVPNDWEKLSAKNLKLGEVLMRTLGNASDKPTTLLNTVETLAKKRGGKFGNNINDLIDFADNLENLYGISQTRSFEGGIQRGVNQAGLPTIPTNKTELLLKAMQAATKTSNQDKINALKAFLGVK